MAKKKREEEKGIEGGWINTFADLMNLLLCFFVLLFSMSTVDADKFEQLVTSMSERISIFDGGGAAINDGAFIASGTNQLVSISQYFNEFENSGEDSKSKEEQKEPIDGDKKSDSQQNQGAEGPDTQEDVTESQQEMLDAKRAQELQQRTEEMYGKIVEEAEKNNVQDNISINMDKNYQYVQISMNGAVLFDSGTAEIKKSTLPLLSKVGDILKIYDSHMIKIEGHTDNVPISGGQYKNNMWLSTARATEVFEYLRSVKKLDPKSMEPTGRGPYDKVGDNKTAEGRARNRRVEIKIYTDE